MADEKIMELQAEIRGVRQVLSMLITGMPDNMDLIVRLQKVEDDMRVQNMHASTIDVVRSYRQILEKKAELRKSLG